MYAPIRLTNEQNLIHLFGVNSQFIREYYTTEMWCALRQVSKGLYKILTEPIMYKLLPPQRPHFRELRHRLALYRRGVDTSPMGSGKTYVTSALAKALKLELFVFGPHSTQQTWREATQHFGLPLRFHTYSEFQRKEKPYFIPRPKPRPTFFLQALEPMNIVPPMDIVPMEIEEREIIDLTEVPVEPEIEQGPKKGIVPRCDEQQDLEVLLTPEWLTMLQTPRLLVLDEAHFAKNASVRSKLLIILIRSHLEMGHPQSCLLLLSATPFDKQVNTVRIARTLGILKSPQLAVMNPQTGELQPRGLQELMDYANEINPGPLPADALIPRGRSITSMDRAYAWIIHKIKPKLFLGMSPRSLPFISNTKNLFCPLEGEDLKRVKEGVDQLRKAMQAFYLRLRQGGGNDLGSISGGLRLIEFGKIPLFIQNATAILNHNPRAKVIIMLNYTDSLKAIAENLARFAPIVIHGPTKKETRPDLVAQFQRSDTKHRLLIANLSVIAQGLDLDDKEGRFPRYMVISPSYHIISLHQGTGRILRTATKSQPTVRFVYVSQVSSELKLLNSLAKKSKNIQSGLDYDVTFPGDHEHIELEQEEWY